MHSRRICSRAAVLAGAFAFVLSAPLAAQGKGYTLDDILGLLRRHVASARVLSLAKSSCVTFVVTDDVDTRIKRAGGTQSLVDGLKQLCNPNGPGGDGATVVPPPAAFVRDAQRRVALASLYVGHVGSGDLRQIGQRLLRKARLSAEPRHVDPEPPT